MPGPVATSTKCTSCFGRTIVQAPDQTIASTTTAYVINIDTTDPDSNGVSIVDGNKVTFAHDGVYTFTYSLQMTSTDASVHNASVWLRKNGTDLADSSSIFAVPSSHGSFNGQLIAVCNYTYKVKGIRLSDIDSCR